ncbi:MAG: class I SAM-dependent methyltransferase [Methanomicrobiales archaeon]
MKNKKIKHIHHGKSSRDILDGADVLSRAGLKSGQIFLDAGCGDGYFSILASSMVGENGKVYAIDIHEDSINNLEKEVENKSIKNLYPIVADVTHKIPLDNDSVDLCLMVNVLHGFVENDEIEKVMGEIFRVIKSGGIFAVVEFKKIKGTPGPPLDVRIYNSEVVDLLINYGFRPVTAYDIGDHHFMVKSTKK